jgi:hypothetical protein
MWNKFLRTPAVATAARDRRILFAQIMFLSDFKTKKFAKKIDFSVVTPIFHMRQV